MGYVFTNFAVPKARHEGSEAIVLKFKFHELPRPPFGKQLHNLRGSYMEDLGVFYLTELKRESYRNLKI